MNKRIIFTILFLAIISGCARQGLYTETRMYMDTIMEISCYSPDKNKALTAIDAAFKEIERLEKIFNLYSETSELSKVNKSAGVEDVKVPQELFNVIESAVHYSKISGGSFDITIAPLVRLWNDARKEGILPKDEEIKDKLPSVGYKNIVLDKQNSTVRFLNRNTKIDLGGIAKGYALDRAKGILVSFGIERALINFGGNIFAISTPPHKNSWYIGVQHPRKKGGIILKVALKDRAVSTSGDYERFFILDGKRYSHIINPITGYPSEGIVSVTIVAPTGVASDALSTAVFVMGIEKAFQFVKTLGDVEVYIYDKDCNLVKSRNR